MSIANDFVIENGVLKKYKGSGGNVVVPEGVTSIGKSAFSGCKSLQSITLPEGVTSIGNRAFKGCKGLADENGFVIVKDILFDYDGSGGNVVVPEGVTRIESWAFRWCEKLQSITLPEGMTSIGNRAFEGCEKLKSITLPEGVTSIGWDAFNGCKSLQSITLPEGVTSIGDSAFYECKSLQSITLPEGVTSIGRYAFSGCEKLQSITLPEGVTSIGSGAFSGCEKLQSITLPEGVTSIGRWAFSVCKSLQSITLPEGLTSIGNSAFYECESLQSITLPESLTSVGKYAFRGSKVTHHISDEVANRPENFIIKGEVLKKYKGIGGNVIIPQGVTTIENYAFAGCSCLTGITLPEGVTSIGWDAFRGCEKLQSITLPEGVTSIGEGAFSGCENLKNLEMNHCKAKLTRDVFDDSLPEGLIAQIPELYPYMADSALIQYVLTEETWQKLDHAVQAEIFLTRQSKALTTAYLDCIDKEQLEPLGNAVLERINGAKPSVKDCNTAAAYMTMFHDKASVTILNQLYARLKECKNSAKAIKTVESHVALMEKLGNEVTVDESLSPVGKKVTELLIAAKQNAGDLEKTLKDYYSLTFKDLPELKSADGSVAEPLVAAWLCTAHEKREKYTWGQTDTVAGYEKPGLCPEAAETVAFLDQASIQSALLKLADENLGLSGRTRKMFLAYPICRYADEELMTELSKRAPKWRSSVSGDAAPPLLTFRQAAMYSNTRAAMLFAERYHELDDYAKVRGMDEDTLRDKYLSDVGLDEQGGKNYDLGNQTVTARLQKDMSFLVELPNGKTAKSLPKKGADAEKYEAAKKDFAEMKKSVKMILKNRGKVLFEDFLSGKKRSAEDWQGSYLNNPLLREAASLVVWSQGKNTFTLKDGAPVNSAEQPYTITDKPIRVAHPMEMKEADTKAWQKYFTAHGLKQPFAQVWEPVRKADDIKEDRYKDCVVEIYRMNSKDKHGIHSYGLHAYSDDFGFTLDECELEYEPSTWRLNWDGATGETYIFGAFKFKKFTRKVNHIVTILDKLTVEDRVLKDDVSVIEMMPGFTLAQITDFIAAAQEANANNILAALLEYKNNNFSDFDPMDEFTLEW